MIEALIAIFIFALAMVMVSGTFSGFMKTYANEKRMQRNFEDAQYAMNLMAKSIRTSSVKGVDPTDPTKIDIFNYSQNKCIEYSWVGESLNMAYTNDTNPGSLDGCHFDNLASSSPLISKGVDKAYFSDTPSLPGSSGTQGLVGKVTIALNMKQTGQNSSVVPIQMSVSLRDYGYTESSPAVCQNLPNHSNPCSGTGSALSSNTNYSLVGSCSSSQTGKCEAVCDSANGYTFNGSICVSSTPADTTAPTTTASPAGGTYTTSRFVTLSCVDNSGGSGCNKTYYTTDGSTPTTTSAVFSSSIGINSNTTLKFFSTDNAGNSGSVKTETYTVVSAADTTPPTTAASPAGGTFTTSQSVTLNCTDNAGGSGCNKTYYTTDGSTPTTSSPVFSSPIVVNTGLTTLKFFSTDKAGNSESVKTETYTIGLSCIINSSTLDCHSGGTFNITSVPLNTGQYGIWVWNGQKPSSYPSTVQTNTNMMSYSTACCESGSITCVNGVLEYQFDNNGTMSYDTCN